jgi:hypothetical protein
MVRAFFPLPWPRARHEKKRLFSTFFLNLLANRLEPDGCFHMVTDQLSLAEWTHNQSLSSALPLNLETKSAILDTKYERKWQTEGQNIFYHLTGQKKYHPEILRPEPPNMKIYHLQNFIAQDFSPQGQTGDITVIFKEFIFDSLLQEGLQHTKVIEGDFIQEFFIRIIKDPDGLWRITPALNRHLFPTPGIQTSLLLIFEACQNFRDKSV